MIMRASCGVQEGEGRWEGEGRGRVGRWSDARELNCRWVGCQGCAGGGRRKGAQLKGGILERKRQGELQRGLHREYWDEREPRVGVKGGRKQE